MARNKVMKLWTAIVTIFLALCTALGLATAATASAAPRTEAPRQSGADHLTVPAMPLRAGRHARSLPPTMKQRIRAEAHGKSPGHRPLTDPDTAGEDDLVPPLQT